MADDNNSAVGSGGMPLGVTIAIAAIVLTGIGVGGYFMYNYFKTPAGPTPPASPNPTPKPGGTEKPATKPAAQTSTAPASTSTTVLQNGSTGNDVITLQTKLNAKGAALTVDGQFGALTQAALQKYYGQPTITTAQLAGWNNEFGGDYNRVFFVKKLPNSKIGGCVLF
jgi:hypothetical protein